MRALLGLTLVKVAVQSIRERIIKSLDLFCSFQQGHNLIFQVQVIYFVVTAQP